eukprot:CAMPEP_0118914018 /NCGR_PEP_ID=MMETSP1166-20130328/14552_1 /TAXON_ID=1104430 /ORGANISM="Chrysoreinhardia sp, Strain CCMP3193" /LENGTH=379 /DNA_ID=CAMNT_0006853583 /DNA_START=99 /DNA_END=1238 /DNA_ORIENTATION=-
MALSTMFQPVKLGAFELKNRFVLASLTRGRSGESRVPNAANVEYYRQRATNFGLLLGEASSISAAGEGWYDSPSLYDESHVEGWKKVTDAVHAEGGLIVAQLWHIGRAGHSSFLGGKQMVSASDVPIDGDGVYTADTSKQPHETPRPLTVEEIQKTIADYKHAAENCKKAGFDGVEVHAANGYLVDQFLQTGSNKRQDDYGGSVENRYRFLREIFQAVTEVYDPSRVGTKLSPNGVFNGMGAADNFETFGYVLDEIDKLGLSYVQVMDGLAFGYHEKCPAMTLDDIRAHLKHTPVMANCGYTPESAEEATSSGKADAVAFGRPTLANPDYVERLKNGYPLNADLPNEHWFGKANHRANPDLGYVDDFAPIYKAKATTEL